MDELEQKRLYRAEVGVFYLANILIFQKED